MIWRLPVTVQSTKDNDFTYHLFTIALITMLELWLGVIAACIPTLAPILNSYGRPAFNKIANTFKSSSSGTPSKGNGDSGGNHVAAANDGSGGVQNFYMASSSYTKLGDSQEAINLGVGQDGRHEDMTALTATQWTQSTASKGLSEKRSYIPTNLSQGQAVTETEITFDPRGDSMAEHDRGVGRGVIHVQRDFSSSYEV